MLKQITFPRSIQQIREYAFSNCRNLENVNFPADHICELHKYAFYQCQKLFKIKPFIEKMYGELTEEEKRFEPKYSLSGEEFHENMLVIILSCGHFSEKEELLEWIAIKYICPFCRETLF
jgi:hypothetical protein